jgi:hypothetical protein
MRSADAGSLVYDSDVLKESMEIVGFPRAFLRVASSARLAHWIVRLEDVHPDGQVSLVTGALVNGSQLRSRLDPEHLIPGKTYDFRLPLHFTTWTFKPGHRIRLAVSNALFPMIWPTPHRMTTQLFLGTETTRLELPVVPPDERQVPVFLPPEPRKVRPDARSLESKGWPYRYQVVRDLNRDTTTVEWAGESWMEIQGCRYFASDQTTYEVNDANPAESSFRGVTVRKILLEDRPLKLETTIHLLSDEESFHVTFTRQIFQRGELVRKRVWEETIPRDFQ